MHAQSHIHVQSLLYFYIQILHVVWIGAVFVNPYSNSLGMTTTAVGTTVETLTSTPHASAPHASSLTTSSALLSSPSPILPLPTSTSLLSSPTAGGSLTVTTPQKQPATPGEIFSSHSLDLHNMCMVHMSMYILLGAKYGFGPSADFVAQTSDLRSV